MYSYWDIIWWEETKKLKKEKKKKKLVKGWPNLQDKATIPNHIICLVGVGVFLSYQV